MILDKRTLEKLRDLINQETQYRKGHEIVAFFNEVGINDTYGPGFPSRWIYTDEKLNQINGTPLIDKCIKRLFAPVNYVGRYDELAHFISDFNQYLAFDGWKIVCEGKDIKFQKADEIGFKVPKTNPEIKEDEFLNLEFNDLKLEKIGLDDTITEILIIRLEEIKKCLASEAPLSVIFMCGSTLEGILLGMALKNPREFNKAISSPKDIDGKVKQFPSWTLSNLIDVSHEVGLLKEDVKKFSHSLRDFRNYIHPYQQLSSRFNPDKHTARISWQVLKAAIFQLAER